MTTPFKVYIPARYGSTRLAGKPLLKIGAKSLLQHVWESAAGSGAREVVIASDDERIREAAAGFGAIVVMTSTEHTSGTERLAEAVAARGEPDDMIIVNVQGDEYGLPAQQIDQVAAILQRDRKAVMATLCEKIAGREQFHNPNVVKVVTDRNGRALYFSRASIPAQHPGTGGADGFDCPAWRHIGIYAYRAGFLQTYTALPPCELELSERLEQLRALFNGHNIHVEEACVPGGMEVNTEADLEQARKTATNHKPQAAGGSD